MVDAQLHSCVLNKPTQLNTWLCLTLPSLSLFEQVDCILQKRTRNRDCVCSGEFLGDCQRESSGWSDIHLCAGGCSTELRRSHYQWLCPLVISCLHLATPGVPSSITDHCLGPTPSPTTSCQMGLLVNKPVCSYPENYLILAPFIPNTIHPSTVCSTCLVRKMGMGEGDK